MMPRDILTVVLQSNSAERLVEHEQARFRRVLRAICEDTPIPLHHRWKSHMTCCICASTDIDCTLNYIDLQTSTGANVLGRHRKMSHCAVCRHALKLLERDRLFIAPNGQEIAAWI